MSYRSLIYLFFAFYLNSCGQLEDNDSSIQAVFDCPEDGLDLRAECGTKYRKYYLKPKHGIESDYGKYRPATISSGRFYNPPKFMYNDFRIARFKTVPGCFLKTSKVIFKEEIGEVNVQIHAATVSESFEVEVISEENGEEVVLRRYNYSKFSHPQNLITILFPKEKKYTKIGIRLCKVKSTKQKAVGLTVWDISIQHQW